MKKISYTIVQFKGPYTNFNDAGLNGGFDDTAAYKIISIIEHINENAQVGKI